MNKFLSIVVAIALVISTAQADVYEGKKVYIKVFKALFGLDGTKFASGHTVDEWEALFADGAKGFIKEYSEKYPKAASMLANPDMAAKIQDVGDFAKEYGSDSGNAPSCG